MLTTTPFRPPITIRVEIFCPPEKAISNPKKLQARMMHAKLAIFVTQKSKTQSKIVKCNPKKEIEITSNTDLFLS
jgi:hypothetical protein